MTRIEQARDVTGGHRMRVNDSAVSDKYLTPWPCTARAIDGFRKHPYQATGEDECRWTHK